MFNPKKSSNYVVVAFEDKYVYSEHRTITAAAREREKYRRYTKSKSTRVYHVRTWKDYLEGKINLA